MAVNLTKERQAKASASQGAEDLAILHPDIELEIAGEAVTFHEYGFLEGLRLRPVLQPLIDAIAAVTWDQEHMSLESVQNALAEHAQVTAQLIAASAGRGVDWVQGLDDEAGQAAMAAWWSANADFFVRRVGSALADLAVRKGRGMLAEAHQGGPMSTPPLSPTDTPGAS